MILDPSPGCVVESASGDCFIWDGKKWLLCDGRLVSRRDHPELYMAIGHIYSDEDRRCCTSELFNLPDLRKKKGEEDG